MIQVTIKEAKAQLSKLLRKAQAGEEIIISEGHKPIGKLIGLPESSQERRIGHAEGIILYIADDFDAPLPEFEEYMV